MLIGLLLIVLNNGWNLKTLTKITEHSINTDNIKQKNPEDITSTCTKLGSKHWRQDGNCFHCPLSQRTYKSQSM